MFEGLGFFFFFCEALLTRMVPMPSRFFWAFGVEKESIYAINEKKHGNID
jgi:hypothetical protein